MSRWAPRRPAITSSAGRDRLAQHHDRQRGRAGARQLDGPAEVGRARDLAPLPLEAVRQRLESVKVGIDEEEAGRLGHSKASGKRGRQYTAGSKETPKFQGIGGTRRLGRLAH